MCMYCYLVCNYNKCSYLRLFVNREQMLDKIINTANKSEKKLVFEIGSNSDLILENTITDNLIWTIKNIESNFNGKITFPTKFDMVDPILNLNHKGKVIIRVSVNPEDIINKVEFGTSRLSKRIEAINKLVEADYEVGIIIAPIILVDDWESLYEGLVQSLKEKLSQKAQSKVFFEAIFMTYSYIHKVINQDAFPNAVNLYNKELMTVRGRGKYTYKREIKEDGTKFFEELLAKYFNGNEIKYIV